MGQQQFNITAEQIHFEKAKWEHKDIIFQWLDEPPSSKIQLFYAVPRITLTQSQMSYSVSFRPADFLISHTEVSHFDRVDNLHLE